MARRIDPYDLYMDDLPDVWEPVPDEYKPLLVIKGGVASKKQEKMINAIVSSRWYFVVNDSTDEFGNRRRCRHCNQIHDYVTLRCVEAPFNSLTEVIGIIRKADGQYVPANEDNPDKFGVLEIDAYAMGKIIPVSVGQAYRNILAIRGRGERNLYPHIP